MIQLYLLACDSQTNHNYNNNNNADVAFANDETKQTTSKTTLNLNNVLFCLRNECNIQSLMVEGGAGVTIFPSILGAVNGISYCRDLESLPSSMSSSLF